MDAPERERTTSEVGELIMNHLKGIDTVAYIRFASVYRDFKDVREFKENWKTCSAAEKNKKNSPSCFELTAKSEQQAPRS